jgi:hypothetical protein
MRASIESGIVPASVHPLQAQSIDLFKALFHMAVPLSSVSISMKPLKGPPTNESIPGAFCNEQPGKTPFVKNNYPPANTLIYTGVKKP